MNYCRINHTSKNVTFRSGRKAKEYYYHIKTKNLFINYSDLECVKECKEMIESTGIGMAALTEGMDYYNADFNTLLGWKNYTLSDLCDSICREFAKDHKSMGSNYDRWTATLRDDGIYLNIRIYEEILAA